MNGETKNATVTANVSDKMKWERESPFCVCLLIMYNLLHINKKKADEIFQKPKFYPLKGGNFEKTKQITSKIN